MQRAEQAGFRQASCSDHFHPWSEDQGHSGFAWSWLGAALQATQMSWGVICAPGQRYHPAIIAQASATLDQMYPGRFWLAVGSGEALNEHITGEPWLPKPERNARLVESVDIIRRLWKGESVTRRGRVVISDAQLYTLPETSIPLLGAALTAETAEWLGEWADGMVTAGASEQGLRDVLTVYRQNGGGRKPIYSQSAIAFADSESAALAWAHRHWRVAGLTSQELSDVDTPAQFDAKTRNIAPEALRDKLRITSRPEQLLEWLAADAGVQRVYLNFLGKDWQHFLDCCQRVILPAVESVTA